MKRFESKLLVNAFFLTVFVLALFSIAYGQQWPISGIVKSSDNKPLEGVTVEVIGAVNVGTSTNENGAFRLSNVTKGAKLRFSSVGFQQLEVTVKDASVLNIVLELQQAELEKVVVNVGYGTVRKKDLTGAVGTVSGKDLSDRKQVRVSQALQGAVAGVMVTRSGAQPDASASIRIRGVTTIGDANPLIIVDGVPGTLDWINPNDIESITVLKDAASASIYGSRAASGVIVVTTKRAKTGQLSLDYTYDYSIEAPTATARYAGAQDYMRLNNERNWNDNNNSGSEFPVFSKEVIDNYPKLNAENPDLYPDINWLSLMMKKNAFRQSHNINLVGGTEKVKSKISLIYDKTEGYYNHKTYDRLILNANTDFNITPQLSAQLDLRGIYSISNSPTFEIIPSTGVAPIYAAMWSDGRIASGQTGVNPFASLNFGGFDKTTATSITPKLTVNYKIFRDMTLTAVVSPELYMSKNKDFVKRLEYTLQDDPNVVAGTIQGNTQTNLNEGRSDTRSIITQFLANYNKTIKDHSLNIMMGNENYSLFSESLGATREQFSLSNFPYLNIGNENYQYNSGSASEYASRSFFGRLMYNYKGKYYIQGNMRYDGSSRFHKDYRWGSFPSVSVGWALSEEGFFPKTDLFSYLKIRSSFGTLGNERIGNYPYQSTIGFNNSLFYRGDQIVSAQTAAITQYAIPDISWEKTASIDVGFDARFINDKLSVTADYYEKTTKDMLLALQIPDYIGLNNPEQNTGKMFTKGWELEVEWRESKGDFGYSIAANISDFKSVMGELGGTQFLGSQVKYKGSEFNEWYGYKSLGLYQTGEQAKQSARLNDNVKEGDIQYQDISGPNGVPDGKISAEYDRVLLGGSLPRYLFGGVIKAYYKDFDFSMSFQGVGKQNDNISTSMIQPFRSQYIEVQEELLGKYWSKYNTEQENANARYPRISNVGNTNNYLTSDFWLFNGAYTRIKNIMIGYKIPQKLIKNVGLSAFQVYLNISDLPAFHNYPKGWDPEGTSYWISTAYTVGARLRF